MSRKCSLGSGNPPDYSHCVEELSVAALSWNCNSQASSRYRLLLVRSLARFETYYALSIWMNVCVSVAREGGFLTKPRAGGPLYLSIHGMFRVSKLSSAWEGLRSEELLRTNINLNNVNVSPETSQAMSNPGTKYDFSLRLASTQPSVRKAREKQVRLIYRVESVFVDDSG